MSPYFKTETKARELCRLSSSYKSRPHFRQTARVFERIKSPEAHRRCFPLRSRFLKTIIKENVRVDLIITYSKPSPTLIAGLQISKAARSTALLRACAPQAPSAAPHKPWALCPTSSEPAPHELRTLHPTSSLRSSHLSDSVFGQYRNFSS